MTYQVSQRRAARLLPMHRGTLRYVARRDDQLALRRRLRELAAVRVRFGYKRLTVLLRREGWRVNAKRVWQLYREEGLTMSLMARDLNLLCPRVEVITVKLLAMKFPRLGLVRQKKILSLGLTRGQFPEISEDAGAERSESVAQAPLDVGKPPEKVVKPNPVAERAGDATIDTVRAELKLLQGEVQRLHAEVERIQLANTDAAKIGAGLGAPDSRLPPVPTGLPEGQSAEALEPGLDALFPRSERG